MGRGAAPRNPWFGKGTKAGASLVAQTVKNLPVMQETQVQSLGSGRSHGEGSGYLLQYSCLQNSILYTENFGSVTK